MFLALVYDEGQRIAVRQCATEHDFETCSLSIEAAGFDVLCLTVPEGETAAEALARYDEEQAKYLAEIAEARFFTALCEEEMGNGIPF